MLHTSSTAIAMLHTSSTAIAMLHTSSTACMCSYMDFKSQPPARFLLVDHFLCMYTSFWFSLQCLQPLKLNLFFATTPHCLVTLLLHELLPLACHLCVPNHYTKHSTHSFLHSDLKLMVMIVILAESSSLSLCLSLAIAMTGHLRPILYTHRTPPPPHHPFLFFSFSPLSLTFIYI